MTQGTEGTDSTDRPVAGSSLSPDGGGRAHRVYGQPVGTWGFGDVGWFLLAVAGTVLATALLFIPVMLLAKDAVTEDGALVTATAAGSWLVVISQVLFSAGMVAWPLIAAWRKSSGWRHAYGFVVSWRALGIGLVGGIVTLIVMTVLTGLTADLLNRDITSAGADEAESLTGSTVAFVLFLLLIAVVSPFVEELAFRGLVWGAALKHGWSPWVATIVAGVPFALIHIEPLRVVPLLAAGIVLGTIRHYAGLSGSMLAHCVVNTIGAVGIAVAT